MDAADVEYRPTVPLPEGTCCPDCGYDLRGSTSERCPECGFPLEKLHTQVTLIPWSHRAELGRLKSYWKTVWLVVRWPRRFCIEMARPVSHVDAQTFRWVTTLHAYLPVLVVSGLFVCLDRLRGWQSGQGMWWFLGYAQVVVLTLLIATPGIASYFFHSRRLPTGQQNRAIALSYYAWAPLALLPLAISPLAMFLLVVSPQSGVAIAAYPITSLVLVAYTVFLAQRRVFRIAQYTLHGSLAATAMRVALLNVLAVLAALLALLVPLLVLYVWIILRSLG